MPADETGTTENSDEPPRHPIFPFEYFFPVRTDLSRHINSLGTKARRFQGGTQPTEVGAPPGSVAATGPGLYARGMRRLAVLLLAYVLAMPALAGERLLVPQLPGWVPLASFAGSDTEVSELIPGGETPDTWTRRLVVQAFRGSDLTVPAFLDLLASKSAALCEQPAAEPMRLGRLGGMEAGSRFMACGRTKAEGRGEYVLHYAIRGRDAFYVVIRAWRGAPFAAGTKPVADREMAEWVAFMRSITLCDSREPTRPCVGGR